MTVDVCPVAELPPGHVKIIWSGPLAIGVYNCDGSYYARFDITTGRPLTLPAYEPVDTFPVTVADGWVKVEVG